MRRPGQSTGVARTRPSQFAVAPLAGRVCGRCEKEYVVPDQLSGKRILVVEDEYFIAFDVKRLLDSREVIVVGPTASVDAGRELIAESALDAAVLDVNLEGDFSYRLADELTRRGVPFIFVTGYDHWALPDIYRSVPRVVKPFSRVDLLSSLESVLPEGAPV
ncbi:MAG: response regulator [Sphingomonas taxi]